MKAYISTNRYRTAILSILLLFIGSGCSLTRNLKDNQALVRKITINGMDKEFSELAVNYVDKEQQPNNAFNLQLYYLFNKSGKKNIGEPPALLDSNLVEFSRYQIERFIQSKGYLKATISDSIVIKKKKAELVFNTVQGPLFKIRKISDSIADKNVRKLYRENRPKFSHLQPGGRFDTDSLAYDRDGFYQVMKRNGYFDFYRQYINFNYDSTFNSSVVDLTLIIDNPADKNTHPIYHINNTVITISKSNGRTEGNADTLTVDSQFRFVDYSQRFKPHPVVDYIFQTKGDLYNSDMQTLTTSRLSELNVFRNVPNPTYTKTADSTNRLNTVINMTPLKRMSDRVEGEFLFSNGRYGYNVGNTFTNRNIFKKAVTLQIKLNLSVLYDNGRNSSGRTNSVENQDFKVGANLVFPWLVTPFNLDKPGKYGVPHTTFSSNYSLFYQKGLVERTSLINSVTYDFLEQANKVHSITPIDIEFSRGSIDREAYAELLKQNRFSYIYLIGRTVFTTGSQYTYQVNGNKLNTFADFTYFKGSLDIGGNMLSLASNVLNTPKDTLGKRTMFGYTFAQYVKTELDLRIYKSFGEERQFILRINPGIGVPFGNSTQLIFEKNFYAGGANDMRAWLPRTLGPGQFNRGTAYGGDTTLRSRLKYIDQLGEIKFITNAEYRFKLANNFFGAKLKGAFFMDAGNVWRLKKQPDNPNGEFTFGNLLNSTAIGVGAGLRFDVSFFVFRLDAAFKFKDPQFTGADQWVLFKHGNELFRTGTFKQAYLYNNRTGLTNDGRPIGDSYNFMQLNFGIGMPF
ncbi:translocation and assembly module lipoprotein TamL [Mucilaginibacter antarcticus]|uniref:BamA/TamA family outer membrane protein n=1 Tax=Mucilaginibacter antarcticus TaxID=1855725 RepID=A0ABW5XU53_9SPHI